MPLEDSPDYWAKVSPSLVRTTMEALLAVAEGDRDKEAALMRPMVAVWSALDAAEAERDAMRGVVEAAASLSASETNAYAVVEAVRAAYQAYARSAPTEEADDAA